MTFDSFLTNLSFLQGGGQAVTVVHDVPLQMMNANDMSLYAEPEIDIPTVVSYIPLMSIIWDDLLTPLPLSAVG